jgi:hypothetical protein
MVCTTALRKSDFFHTNKISSWTNKVNSMYCYIMYFLKWLSMSLPAQTSQVRLPRTDIWKHLPKVPINLSVGQLYWDVFRKYEGLERVFRINQSRLCQRSLFLNCIGYPRIWNPCLVFISKSNRLDYVRNIKVGKLVLLVSQSFQITAYKPRIFIVHILF